MIQDCATTQQDLKAKLDSVKASGKRPVILVATMGESDRWKRVLSDWDLGFGVDVEPLDFFLRNTAELVGDERELASSFQVAIAVLEAFKRQEVIPLTPETFNAARQLLQRYGDKLARAAATDLSASLSTTERGYIALVADACQDLASQTLVTSLGLLETISTNKAVLDRYHFWMADSLTILSSETERTLLKALGAEPLGIDSSAALLRIKEMKPADECARTEVTNLVERVKGGFIHREFSPVEATGSVSMVLPSGPVAENQALWEALTPRDSDWQNAVVFVNDPLEVFQAFAKRTDNDEITLNLEASIPLAQTAPGRLLLSMIRLLEEPQDAVAIATDIALNPLSGIVRSEAYRLSASWRKNRALTDDVIYQKLFSVLGEEAQAALRSLSEDSFESALGALVGLKRKVFGARLEDVSTRNALNRLEQLQESVAQIEPRATPLTRLEAQILLDSVVVPLSIQMGEGSRCITISTLAQAPSSDPQSFDVVVLGQLNSSQVKAVTQKNAVDTLAEKLGLEAASSDLETLYYRFDKALELAKSQLIFERTLFNSSGSEEYPSVLFELATGAYRRDLEGRAEMDSSLGVPKVLLPYVHVCSETDITRNLTGKSSLAPAQEVALKPYGEITEDNRSFIVLPQPTSEGPRVVLSPSAIESYLECPYKWFSLRRLHLRDLDEGFSPIERGIFVHEVLKEFYQTLKESGIGRVLPENIEQCQQIFSDVFDRCVEEQPTEKPGRRYLWTNQWEYQQVVGLKTPLLDYIAFEADFLKGFEPVEFEWPYGPDSEVSYAGQSICGTVDRIDSDGRGHFVVIDYKTSIDATYDLHGRTQKEFELPKRTQALIYSKIVGELLGGEVVGALYVNPLKCEVHGAYDARWLGPELIPTIKSERSALPFAGLVSFDHLISQTEELVSDKIDRMLAGHIQPGPLYDGVCKHCPAALCEMRTS